MPAIINTPAVPTVAKTPAAPQHHAPVARQIPEHTPTVPPVQDSAEQHVSVEMIVASLNFVFIDLDAIVMPELPQASQQGCCCRCPEADANEQPTGDGLPTDEPVGNGGPTEDPRAAAQGRTVSSIGDPHETSGDGLKFDNMKRGDFTKLQSERGDFVLQTRQSPYQPDPKATVNTAVGLQLGPDKVAYDVMTNALAVNGERVELEVGASRELPGGGRVLRTVKGLEITSPAGDHTSVEIHPHHIDLHTTLAPSRRDGEVRGSLGTVDADTDTANDLVGRDGNVYGHSAEQIDRFLDTWRVAPEASLLPAA